MRRYIQRQENKEGRETKGRNRDGPKRELTFLQSNPESNNKALNNKARLSSSLLHKVTVYLPPQLPSVGGSLWNDGCRAELIAEPGGSGRFPRMDLTSLALRTKTKGEGIEIL